MTTYFISAGQLHDRLIESMRSHGRHMGHNIDEILDGHTKHPLDQVINSSMVRAYLHGKRNKWTKCAEKMPDHGIYLIYHDPQKNGTGCIMLGFYDTTGRWCNYPTMDDLDKEFVTHWMEIKEPHEHTDKI